MATQHFHPAPAPAELRERFLPQEAPTFELLRQKGRVQLWKSITAPHKLFGVLRASRQSFHVTNAARIAYCHMRSLDLAAVNFEHEAAQYAEEARHG